MILELNYFKQTNIGNNNTCFKYLQNESIFFNYSVTGTVKF